MVQIDLQQSPKAPYTNNDIQSKMLMHVELFVADDKSALDAFLSNSAGLATGPVDFAHVKIEGEVKLVTQHDWKELGFTIIEETNDNSDGYVGPDQIASPLFQDIFKRVDGINSQNGQSDDVRTGTEIRNTLQQDKNLRSDLYKMIAGHPSEWHQTTQTNMKTKFDELNAQNTDENYKKANQLELDKFLKCEFVSQVDGLTQKLWHFHPVILPGVLSNDDEMDLKWLKVSKGQLTFDAEGNDIENSIYFPRHPHVPIEEQFITRKQQHFLFNAVYQYLYDVTERTLSKGENINGEKISIDIRNYEQKTQDVLVDLTFRGDNRKATRKYFLKNLKNGRDEFKENISNSYWIDGFGVPMQRFNLRKDYI